MNFNHNSDLYSTDILCLVETFLNGDLSSSEFNIDDFNLERKDRLQRSGGGIVSYIRSNLSYTRRNDLECDNLEIMWLEIKPFKCRCFLLASVYRPPDTTHTVDLAIINNFEQAFLEGKEMVVCGDFNVDLLSNQGVKHLIYQSCLLFNMDQLVDGITRPASLSCLDHIYVLNREHFYNTSICKIGLSDHFPVLTSRKLNVALKKSGSRISVKYRSFKYFSEDKFISDLRNAPWYLLDGINDVNRAFDVWISIFNNICDSHCPVINRRVKRFRQPKWLNNEILNAMKKRDLCLKRARLGSTDSLWNEYKSNRNKVVHLIMRAKLHHFRSIIAENSNATTLWRVYNNLTKSNNYKNPTFTSEHYRYENNSEIANAFNSHFVGLTQNTGDHRDSVNLERLQQFVHDVLVDLPTFTIPPITYDFVYLSLLQAKSTGIDNVNHKLLKVGASVISNSLTHMFNMSLRHCIFPNVFKCARVVPLYKGTGDICEMLNYRPISILPALSKILERHVHNALFEYFTSSNLLLDTQSGFRKNYSCQTALIRLTDEILKNIDNGFLNGVILLDLSKAFDLIDHDLLLKKLSVYGLSDCTINWFHSYLTNRQQVVDYMGCISVKHDVTVGVPQGSILGPLLFMIFMNDMSLFIDCSTLHMYADDQTMLAKGKCISDVNDAIRQDIIPISNWITANHMRINARKSKCLLITTHSKRSRLNETDRSLSVQVADTFIPQVQCGGILGVTLDETLSWNVHIDNVSKILSQRIGLLRRLRQYIPFDRRIILYYGLIQSILDYCCVVWGNTTAINLDKIYGLQKRALRTLFELSIDFPSNALFSTFNVMSIRQRIFYFMALLSFKCMNGYAPQYLSNLFTPQSNVHDYFTRSTTRKDCHVPRCVLGTGQRSFHFRATKVWNSLPTEVKNVTSLHTFMFQKCWQFS